MAADFDFFDPGFQENSHREYERLREQCPVAHAERPFDWFMVTRESDIKGLLKNYRLWTSDQGPGLAYRGGGVLVSVDPPQHTSDRRLVNKAFAPADLLAMEPEIRGLITELIDSFCDRCEGDLMQLLAVPVPLIVIAWLLGLDADYVQQIRPRADLVIHPNAVPHPIERTERTEEAEYFQSQIDERRAALAAGSEPPDDTLTSLITAELDGRTLSDEEVIGFMGFLFIAGSQTTTQLIGNMIYRLLQHPEQMAKVQADRSLIPNAVEESLRYDSPVHGLFRTNTEAVEIDGVIVPPDTKVLCTFAAANLDPEVWDDPMTFNIERPYEDLKRHYAFGKGIHYCMGAPLARVEAQVALELVLDRLPNLRLTAEPTEISAHVMHGVETLNVAWDLSEES